MGDRSLAQPGSGPADVTAGFTNMQWYMYQQHNVAFFAAFSQQALTHASLVDTARNLIELTPQLLPAHRPGEPVSDSELDPLLQLSEVDEFDGFPDRFLDAGKEIYQRPDLPLFRIKAAVRRGGADRLGRAAFVLVQVSHALVEGADSALLSRSRSAAHTESLALPIGQGRTRPTSAPTGFGGFAGWLLGGPAALGHLLAASFYEFRPGPFGFATHSCERLRIVVLARQFGVRQRALLFALGLTGLFGRETLAKKRKITTTYSTIDSGGESTSGGFMRMRMLFAAFPSSGDLAAQARQIDKELSQSEGHESGFNQALNLSALNTHRRLYRRFPFAYRQQVFNFMPYDAVLGLIPPHRLQGALTRELLEPVYAGAALDGANACVLVPGRTRISFNFYAETRLHPHIAEMAALLESLSPGQSKPS